VEELHPVAVVVQVRSRDPAAAPAVGGGRAAHHPQGERATAQDAALLRLHVLRLGFVFSLLVRVEECIEDPERMLFEV